MTETPTLTLEETACLVCRSERSRKVLETVDHLYGVPGLFCVHQCLDCGHQFMNPVPTPETLRNCYPEHYGPHQTEVPEADGVQLESVAATAATPWYLKYLPLRYIPGLRGFYYWLTDDLGQPLPAVPDRVDGSDCPRALELGCSTGAYLSRLQGAGWQVTGIEPSEVASEKARTAGFDVHTGFLGNIDLQDQYFDAVAAWMVVEHTIDPVKTLVVFRRLLKPGGQLLFSVPNVQCWEPGFFGSVWYAWEPPRHLNHFGAGRIRQILKELKYVEVEVLYQRNVLYVVGSLGILLKRWWLTRKLGERLLRYPEAPHLAIQLLLSPLAHLLSFLRQGGRITVLARRPSHDGSVRRTEEAAR